jgi:hypothetical protein
LKQKRLPTMKLNLGTFEYVIIITTASYLFGLLFLLLNRISLF